MEKSRRGEIDKRREKEIMRGRGKRCRRARQEERMDYVCLPRTYIATYMIDNWNVCLPLMALSVPVHIRIYSTTISTRAQMQTFTYTS